MALTASRNTIEYGEDPIPQVLTTPVAASTKIYQGGMVGVDSSGNAIPASSSAVRMIGVAQHDHDNSSGAAGAMKCRTLNGAYWFANSASTDAIAAANVGADCFVVDDQTVALTDNAGARPLAGKVVAVDATLGVAVQIISGTTEQGVLSEFVTIPVPTMSTIADGVLFAFTPTRPGKIRKLSWSQWLPVSTGSKQSTVHPEVAGTPVTGGVVTLTSAALNSVGAALSASAITGANSFAAGQQVTLKAATTTSFVEGSGAFILEITAQ